MLQQNLLYINDLNRFLNIIDDDLFIARSEKHEFTGSIGAHTRHVIEFYRQFLTSLTAKEIDYDSRQRDQAIESSKTFAIQNIIVLQNEINAIESDVQDSLCYRNDKSYPSSIGRELCYLAEHTIHHFALIRLIAESKGFDFNQMPDFGVAPSTLKFRSLQSQ